MAEVLGLQCTLYYLCLEQDHEAGEDAAFRDVDGKVLHRGSSVFFDSAVIEGAAKLGDGRVLSYARKVDGEARWAVASAAYGLGFCDCPLIPLRSVAVDRSVVPLRSILHIEETVGLRLPDGSRHDGRWYAMDVSSGIGGHRVDLFAGAGKASMQPIHDFGIRHLQRLTASIVGTFSGCPK
jgi:hypothetical protein